MPINCTGYAKVFMKNCSCFHFQEELERRREECIQLRTVLANVSLDYQDPSLSLIKNKEMPETEEVLAAYETQKVIIAQLQDQLNEERSRGTVRII